MFHTLYLGVLLCVAGSQALYDSSSDVVELTPSNFDRLVTNSEEVWIVEFYAPWCGHCKNLVPEYKKAAKALKGIIKVGAVDADQHKSLSSKYGVTGFPTIKIFTGSKHTPYQGQRTADAFVDAGIKAAKERAYDNLGKKSGGSGDKRQLYGHNIPWKKIQRTIEKLKEHNVTQPKNRKPVVQKPLLNFRKPQVPKPLLSFHAPPVRKSQNKFIKRRANDKLNPRVQKPLLSFRSPPVKKSLSQPSTPQAVIHKKLNMDKLHEQLFRANDQIQTSQKLQRLSRKNLVHKSPVKRLELDNLRLFTNHFDSANERPPKHIIRNSNKQVKKLNAPNHPKTGSLPKKVRNRKLAKHFKQANKSISTKKILHERANKR